MCVALAADLFDQWWKKLRLCEYGQCGVWFLPNHGRQIYHTHQCSQQARSEKHVASGKKKKRDYHEEYKARVQKKLGAKVRPSRRPRRSKR